MTTSQDAKTQPIFDIQRLYVKEQSCKLLHGSSTFLEEWKPDVQLEMNVKHEKLRDSIYEVVLQIHLTAKNNQRTAFVIEVQQAGIFKIEGLEEKQIQFLLEARCPNILYSYARKVVSDKTVEAGFPSLLLTPVDFEVLFMRRQEEKQKQTDNKTDPAKPQQTVVH